MTVEDRLKNAVRLSKENFGKDLPFLENIIFKVYDLLVAQEQNDIANENNRKWQEQQELTQKTSIELWQSQIAANKASATAKKVRRGSRS